MKTHTRLEALRLGASSQSIAAHLAGYGKQDGFYPLDSGDFGRCEGLLVNFPDFRAELHRMAEVNAYWAALVPRWEEIRATTASDAQTALIKAIVVPIQTADPYHVPLGGSAYIRLGPNAFKGAEAQQPKQETPPMAGKGHNSGDATAAYNVTADELRSFIERAEQLASEKKDLAEHEKELFAEAKGRGYCTKTMRKLIALRKQNPDEIAEQEAVLEMYKSALGM